MKAYWLSAGALVLACCAGHAGTDPQAVRYVARVPLFFEANAGQAAPEVKYLARGSGYDIVLGHANPLLTVRERPVPAGGPPDDRPVPGTVHLSLADANPAPIVTAEGMLPGTVSYFRGRDVRQWHTGISTWQKVRYRDVYPGIDLLFYGSRGRVEYDFVVAPGADPAGIRLAFQGQRDLRIGADGNLTLGLSEGDLVQHAPRVYQVANGRREPVSARYRMGVGGAVTFEIGAYDAARPLLIDPVLEYSSYLGGSAADHGWDVAVDSAGNLYVVGTTQSVDFPLANPLQPTNPGDATFVAKLNPSGTALVFATYLSGPADDVQLSSAAARAIAVDGAGNVYVTGTTTSSEFPVRNAVQPTCVKTDLYCVDAFVAKLNPSGSALVYSTYLGGGDHDFGHDIAVDGAGNAVVVGNTLSTGDFASPADFPTVNALQPDPGGGVEAFVSRFGPSGGLRFSTYLGGNGFDSLYGVAVDGSGDAYAVGATTSPAFPVTPGAFQEALAAAGGTGDAVAVKVEASGAALEYATYLGGSGVDDAIAVAVDGAGNAYLTGETDSRDFPTRNALQPVGDGRDVFVTKLNPTGRALIYSTTLGGTGTDIATGIAVDAGGHAHVTGQTTSRNLPTAEPFRPYCPFADYSVGDPQSCRGLFSFVTKLGKAGSALDYSTYFVFGIGRSVAVDDAGSAWVIGTTWNEPDFPIRNAVQPERPSDEPSIPDAFLAKFTDAGPEPNAAPVPLLSLGDVNGNGTPDVAILHTDGSRPLVARVLDAGTGTQIRRIAFSGAFQPLDTVVLPDLNGNAAPELAVLEKALDGGDVRVQIRDSRSGRWQGAVYFDRSLVPEHLAMVPDLNGNGAAELAVLGLRREANGGYARTAQVRDSRSNALLNDVDFLPFPFGGFTRAQDFTTIPDANGNGTAELAVLDRLRARVEIRDPWSGDQVNRLFFQQWIYPEDMGVLPDVDGNGVAEIAVRGRDDVSVTRTMDALSANRLGTAYFSRTFRQEQLVVIPDLNGSGVAELAVLSVSPAGLIKAEIRDAATNRLVRDVWFGRLTGVRMAVLPDANGNGASELAVLGRTWQHDLQVVIRDSATGAPIRVLRL